jgi:hypothetical protein
MPIDIDVNSRMKCFGKIDTQCEDDCEDRCCFIEMDLCIEETKRRKEGVIKRR